MTNEPVSLLAIPRLSTYTKQVEQVLNSLLASASPEIRKPALRVLRSGGKRFRPILVIAAAMAQGNKPTNAAIKAAAAIELAHLASIVHDDIIDNADVRWGQPTISRQEGIDSAILVGDYLLALAAAQAATVSQDVALTVASAIASMCEGQSEETADKYNLERSIDSYFSAIRKKTGALISAACIIGGLSAKPSKLDTRALAAFGEAFGMSFQLTDDILDILSTSEAMGKPVGNDIKEGVYTLPVLLSLKGPSRSRLKKLIRTRADQSAFAEALLRDGSIKETLGEIKKQNQMASNSINRLGKGATIKGLSKLPEAYHTWAMRKQTVLQSGYSRAKTIAKTPVVH